MIFLLFVFFIGLGTGFILVGLPQVEIIRNAPVTEQRQQGIPSVPSGGLPADIEGVEQEEFLNCEGRQIFDFDTQYYSISVIA
jgi:hypothetical protein